ncbi:unnamed protein product [Gordionus sp. m RMFG-2023]
MDASEVTSRTGYRGMDKSPTQCGSGNQIMWIVEQAEPVSAGEESVKDGLSPTRNMGERDFRDEARGLGDK